MHGLLSCFDPLANLTAMPGDPAYGFIDGTVWAVCILRVPPQILKGDFLELSTYRRCKYLGAWVLQSEWPQVGRPTAGLVWFR